MRLSALALLALIALPATGCTRFPDLDEAIELAIHMAKRVHSLAAVHPPLQKAPV